MKSNNTVEKATAHISQLFKSDLGKKQLFHNFNRTLQLTEIASELIGSSTLEEETGHQVLLAVLFLYSGYSTTEGNPQKQSVAMAKRWLSENGHGQEFIDRVTKLMESSEGDQVPAGKAEGICYDVAHSFYGMPSFQTDLELLRLEKEAIDGNKIERTAWREMYIAKLTSGHRFATLYAQQNWEDQKTNNLTALIQEGEKELKSSKKAKLKVNMKETSPQRGVQTLYRVTLRNHLKLSDIADTKANILLSVNAIIISLILANMAPKLDSPSNAYLLIPTSIFILFSIVSMILSVLATRPKVTKMEYTDEAIKEGKVNLLFFGNFNQIAVEDYMKMIKDLISDKEKIYNMLTMDLYYLGAVLERKYKILRWTYTIFMTGLILSVVSYAIALKYYAPEKVMEAVKPLTQ
ncbi:MAG: Pycsar system effector family protein [Sediminicola sp.]|tara:strand:+ start:50564 stop:51784 length:1221 start_codon:yes stop_codon:yes gene_type:complete